MIKIKFHIAYLKAACLFTPKKNKRPELAGVYLNLANRNLNASDGGIAFISKPGTLEIESQHGEVGIKGLILPTHITERLISIKCDKAPESYIVNLTIDENKISATLAGITMHDVIEDRHYPNFNRIYHLDDSSHHKTITYDYHYLKQVADCQKALLPLIPKEEIGIMLNMGNSKTICSVAGDLAQIIIMGIPNYAPFTFYTLEG